jgi:hypothetical protein
MRRFVLLAAANLVLLLAAFGLVHLVNYGHLNISGTNQDLLKIQVLVWLGASLIARKFSRIPELSFIMGSGLLSPEIRGQLLKNKTRTYPFHACPMKQPKGLLVLDQGFIGALPVLCNLTPNLPIPGQTQSV